MQEFAFFGHIVHIGQKCLHCQRRCILHKHTPNEDGGSAQTSQEPRESGVLSFKLCTLLRVYISTISVPVCSLVVTMQCLAQSGKHSCITNRKAVRNDAKRLLKNEGETKIQSHGCKCTLSTPYTADPAP